VTNEQADRLVVPSTSILRQGSRSVVMVVVDGHAVEKAVLTRPAMQDGIPISGAVTDADDVVVDPAGITAGQPVRMRRQRA
jgi:hypothetical protein